MITVILFLFIFAVLLTGLYIAQRKKVKFTTRVFLGLIIGIIFGGIMQQFIAKGYLLQEQTNVITGWLDLVGIGYTHLLMLVIQPLILVSILSAIINLDTGKNIAKIASTIVGILIFTTMIAALIGVMSATVFNLDASDFTMGEEEIQRAETLNEKSETVGTVSEELLAIIPSNIFVDLANQRPTSTLGVVIFAALLGMSIKYLEKDKNNQFLVLKDLINASNLAILVMVDFILILTPYGVFAIMTKTIALSSYLAILQLFKFVIASYVGLFLIYLVHLSLIAMAGLNPIIYVKKTWTVMSFAFVSRSSAASIPISSEAQHKMLGVDEGVAAMASSLGSTIGQNGCAGLYPAMLTVMIAVSVGQPITIMYIIKLLVVIGISSFGVAGVGGGATYASIIVLSTMGLPIELAAVLVSIEPIIDMGRTMINVNDAMVAGVITAKRNNLLDKEVYNSLT